MERKDAYIVQLELENATLKKMVESLINRVTTLEKEVARLSMKKNSQNS
jgi:hypothetical protein